MANVLNRETRQLILSANTPDYPPSEWIINPELSAVAGWPARYWKIDGNAVTLMTVEERNALDVADLNAARDGAVAALDGAEDLMRAFALVMLDEINLLRAQHQLAPRTPQQLKNAVRAKLGS